WRSGDISGTSARMGRAFQTEFPRELAAGRRVELLLPALRDERDEQADARDEKDSSHRYTCASVHRAERFFRRSKTIRASFGKLSLNTPQACRSARIDPSDIFGRAQT